MTDSQSVASQESPRWMRGLICLAVACLATSVSLQTALSDASTATGLLSPSTYTALVESLGGSLLRTPGQPLQAEIAFVPVLSTVSVAGGLFWVLGSIGIAVSTRQRFAAVLAKWAFRGGLWWLLPGLWEGLSLAAFLAGLVQFQELLMASVGLWYAVAFAGSVAAGVSLSSWRSQAIPATPPLRAPKARVPVIVWAIAVLYVVAYTAMNWQLYNGLLVPHGDSAMYEEHLWNVMHGKGFRSYLDQGLFLGEHAQVIHLFLIPLYALWPSHLLLELCESLALASGAFPVFWLAARHTGSRRAAVLLSAAYLLYFPMQCLDISIDIKTFRPISFGVPMLLFALDQLERRRYVSMTLLLMAALSAKEDFAIVIAPLGVWIALFGCREPNTVVDTNQPSGRSSTLRLRMFGAALALFGVLYLLLVVSYVIPWFRDGVDPHFVGYFSKFGDSTGEVLRNILFNPQLLLGELVTANNCIYMLLVLLPLGFASLGSPSRLAVGAPLFMLLCLNELARDPRHHFHAPLVPILFWSAAAGLPRLGRLFRPGKRSAVSTRESSGDFTITAASFVLASALATGALFGTSPLSRRFWDPGSDHNWRRLYVPGKRAEFFPRIAALIPPSSRVASTDFVHPRFTHHERSYDYSNYPRRVNDDKPGAPPDTDYIVIDTTHRYSEITKPDQIREYREHPKEWELLPDDTEGHFIVLKRRFSQNDGGP